MATYIFLVFLSAVLRYPMALFFKKVYRDSWNQPHSFVKTLKPYRSVAYHPEHGYFSFRPRALILSWITFPLCPVYWIIQIVYFCMMIWISCEYYLNYGDSIKEVPEDAYL